MELKIKKMVVLFALLIIFPCVFAQEEVSMHVQLDFAEEKVSVSEVGLSEGIGSNLYIEEADYYAIISSLSGETFKVDFSFATFIFIDSFTDEEESGIEMLDESSILLFFPYYRDVDKLEVYDAERRLLLTYDLSEYRVCQFDGICGLDENVDTCPEDCLEEAEEKPEVEEVAKEIKEKKIEAEPARLPVSLEENKLYIYIILGIVAFFIIILIVKRRKK